MSIYSELTLAAVNLAINLITVGSLVAAGVTVALKAAPALHPRARYLIGLVAFSIAALWPVFATFSPALAGQVRVPVPFAVSRQQTTQAAAEADADSKARPHGNRESLSPGPWRDGVGAINGLAARWNNTPLAAGFFCLWIIVAAALLSRELVGHVRLARRRRSWRPSDSRLRHEADWRSNVALFTHTDDGVGPFTAGFFRAAVVIPEALFIRLPRHELRLVARHELAHARWRDPLFNSLLRVTRALLWPSLPLWYLERVLRLEREAAADRAALGDSQTPERPRLSKDYASLLVSLAGRGAIYSGQQRCGFIADMAGQSELEARVRRLLTRPMKPSAFRLSVAWSSMFAGLLLITLLPLASRPGEAVDLQSGSLSPTTTAMREMPPSSLQIGGMPNHVLTPRSTPTSGGQGNARSTPGRQTRPTDAPHDSSTETPARDSAQADGQQLRRQPSLEIRPEPVAQPSVELAVRNERMTGGLTAERAAADSELAARNAEWTRKQNAAAARELPARNAEWTREQNEAAARELPARNAQMTREQNAAMNAEMSGAMSTQPGARQNTDQVRHRGRQRD